jgi:hypothetical protein
MFYYKGVKLYTAFLIFYACLTHIIYCCDSWLCVVFQNSWIKNIFLVICYWKVWNSSHCHLTLNLFSFNLCHFVGSFSFTSWPSFNDCIDYQVFCVLWHCIKTLVTKTRQQRYIYWQKMCSCHVCNTKVFDSTHDRCFLDWENTEISVRMAGILKRYLLNMVCGDITTPACLHSSG